MTDMIRVVPLKSVWRDPCPGRRVVGHRVGTVGTVSRIAEATVHGTHCGAREQIIRGHIPGLRVREGGRDRVRSMQASFSAKFSRPSRTGAGPAPVRDGQLNGRSLL